MGDEDSDSSYSLRSSFCVAEEKPSNEIAHQCVSISIRGSCSHRGSRKPEPKRNPSLFSTCSSLHDMPVVINAVEKVETKIPENFNGLLHQTLTDFIVAFMLEKPKDVIAFALQHFTDKQNLRKQSANVMEESSEVSLPSVYSPKLSQQKLLGNRRKSVCSERCSLSSLDDEEEIKNKVRPSVFAKSLEQYKRLKKAIKDILIFKGLQSEQISTLLEVMNPIRVYADDVIMRCGEESKNFYVIDSGTFNVYDKQGELITVAQDMGTFGEVALLYNSECTETVVAATDGLLWVMDHTSFRYILLQHAYRKQKMYEELVENVPMFKELHQYELIALAEVLKPMSFSEGATIMKQGDTADGMYFIESGTVSVWKDPALGTSKGKREMLMCKLSKGQYFGELALLTHENRRASIYAETDVKLAFIDKESFERLLGKCIDILNRNIEDYNYKDPTLVSYLSSVSSKRLVGN